MRPDEDRLLFPNVFSLFGRHKYLVALPAVAGAAAGMIGYLNAPPRYVSEAVLVLDSRRIQALPTEAVVSPLPQDSPALRSEIDIMNSTMLAQDVVKRLETAGIPIPLADEPASPSPVIAKPAKQNGQGSDASVLLEKANRLLSGLSVANDGHSYTIYIAFRDRDPGFSATVADTFAKTYVDHQIETQRQDTLRVAEWLGSKLDALRGRLEASEKAAEDFRRKAGLTQVDGMTIQAQRVTSLNTEITNAEATLAGVEARLATARKLQQSNDVPALSEILGSTVIQTLRSDQAEAQRKLAAIEASGASKSDQIPVLKNEITGLQSRIDQEVNGVIESLETEITVARQKRESVAQAFRKAQENLSRANQDAVHLGQIEREVNANRAVYESYLARYKQAIEQEGMVTPEAQLISTAAGNTRRESPRLLNWLGLGFALGACFGLAIAMLSELRSGKLRSPRRVEAITGSPVVGYIPKLSKSQKSASPKALLAARSEYGRALGNLHATLRSGQTGEGLGSQAIAIVSAQAGAGKTCLTLGLARFLAASGKRVVAVDANLQNPELAKAFGVDATAFLDETPDLQNPVSDLLCGDPQSHAFVIAARGSVTPAEHLLSSNRFLALIEGLKQQFDYVLIDTPDLEGSADALHIAIAADASLFVVRADMAKPESIVTATENLAACQRRPLGLVLNRFRPLRSGFFADDEQSGARKRVPSNISGFSTNLTGQPAGV
jgi:uncharacterized protein involved in exopolysaccharide biosynthesis/Mrp family chromosome partitioning ATPase